MAHRKVGAGGRKWACEPVRILVDMDGVVADFELHLLNLFREKFPDEPYLPLKDRTTFYASDQYVSTFGEYMKKKVLGIVNSSGFFRHIPPVVDAVEAVKEMSSMDRVEVFLCTSHQTTSNFSATDKLDWITEHFGQSWSRKIIMTHDKTLVHGDLLIDDRHRITGSVKTPSWRHVLFTQCHNRHVKVDGLRITDRLDSWSDRAKWRSLIEECIKSRA